jgi:hypothetical protein
MDDPYTKDASVPVGASVAGSGQQAELLNFRWIIVLVLSNRIFLSEQRSVVKVLGKFGYFNFNRDYPTMWTRAL